MVASLQPGSLLSGSNQESSGFNLKPKSNKIVFCETFLLCVQIYGERGNTVFLGSSLTCAKIKGWVWICPYAW